MNASSRLSRGLQLGFTVGMVAGVSCALPVLLANAYLEGGFYRVDVRDAGHLFQGFFTVGFVLTAGLSLARPLYARFLPVQPDDPMRDL